jgi:glutamate/tyrosine decarboxylase-like PLP-dependent enzyme
MVPSQGGRQGKDRTRKSSPPRQEPPPGGPDEDIHFIEPDGGNREAVRRLGYRFIDLLVEAFSSAGERPPFDRDPAGMPASYAPSLEGRGIDELWPELERIVRHGMNPSHPGYLGHMDSIASTIGIFSDALVSALNNNMLAWEMSPLFTELERRLTRWACSLFGLGEGEHRTRSGPTGHLVSGGTLANMTALLVARNSRGGTEGVIETQGLFGLAKAPVFLASENAHFSFQKAANLLGLGRDGWVRVPADERGRVRIDAMAEAVDRVRREGRRPFCVVGVAGTTVTGSFDPLEAIGDLARREGLWFHVDAAYGGAVALSDSLRGRLAGIDRADSITFNPQKWLFVPKTCASVLFRDASEVDRHLREPFVYGTSNRDANGGAGMNLGEWTLQGTRRVDALKLYLTLEHFGRARLASIIEHGCDLARRFAAKIEAHPELQLVQPPDLNIVCFRYRGLPHWPEWSEDSPIDRLNARIQERIERAGHAWLSLPRYGSRRFLRAVILHPRCDDGLLDRLLDEVLKAGRELIAARERAY